MRLLLPAFAALALTAAAAISMARGAESALETIAVTSAWARATPPGASVGAAYVTVRNGGSVADRLIGAATPIAETAGTHETIEENGVAQMRSLKAAVIAPGETLEMRPGATHIMLSGLSAPLRKGDTVPLTLVFERAGSVNVAVSVASIGAESPSAGHRH